MSLTSLLRAGRGPVWDWFETTLPETQRLCTSANRELRGGGTKAKVPAHDDEDLITPKIESAVRAFRARGASIDDKRHAVRDLADVLEAIRPEAKQAMQSKDEGALFDLANNFAIRHHTIAHGAPLPAVAVVSGRTQRGPKL